MACLSHHGALAPVEPGLVSPVARNFLPRQCGPAAGI